MFKKFLAIVLTVAMVLTAVPMFSVYASAQEDVVTDVWDGTFVEPVMTDDNGNIIINTAEELAWVALRGGDATVGKSYKVVANARFDLSRVTQSTADGNVIDTQWKLDNDVRTTQFQGNFDGNGLIVSNMYSSGFADAGLFPLVKVAANSTMTIKNVKVTGAYFVGYHAAGGIVGYANGTPGANLVFENCEVENSTITDNRNENSAAYKTAGGIAGHATHNTVVIKNCYVHDNQIIGTNISAGFVGNTSAYAKSVTISNSVSLGVVPYPVTTNETVINTPIANATYTDVYTEQAVDYNNPIYSGIVCIDIIENVGLAVLGRMSALDWVNVWGPTEGLPVLRLFGGNILDVPTECAHSYIYVDGTPADCLVTGLMAHQRCELCNKLFVDGNEVTYESITIPLTDHNFTYVEEIPVDCENDGIMAHEQCEHCGILFFDGMHVLYPDITIMASGHRMTFIAEVPATAIENGTKAHQMCVNCEKRFLNGKEVTADALIIPATGEIVIPPVEEKVVTGIVLRDSSYKTVYNIGEQLDLTGISLQIGYSNATIAIVNATELEGLIVTGFDSSRVGTVTVNLMYQNYTVDFTVEIVDNGGDIGCKHNTNNFYYTDHGDGTHSKVCAICGTSFEIEAHSIIYTERVEPTCTRDGYGIGYCEVCGAEETIFIQAFGHDMMFIAEVPATATANGVKAHEKCASCGMLMLDGKEVTQSELIIPATGEVTPPVDENGVFRIVIMQLPYKTEYYLGEELETDGLEIGAYSKDGTVVKLTPAMTDELLITGYDSWVLGTQQITVTYSNCSAVFTVDVTEQKEEPPVVDPGEDKEVAAVRIYSEPNKKEYKLGEDLDLTGLALQVVYMDKTEEIITAENTEFDVFGFDSETVGEKYVEIYYGNTVLNFVVNVVADEVVDPGEGGDTDCTHDALVPMPEILPTCENEGVMAHDMCDLCGAIFVDGKEVGDAFIMLPTTDHILTHFDEIPADSENDGVLAHDECDNCGKLFVDGVEVSVEELIIPATGGDVTDPGEGGDVTDRVLTEIFVANPPYKTEYALGEELDLSGMLLDLVYSDGYSETKSFDQLNISVEGFDSETEGEQIITVYYEGLVTEFIVYVVGEPVDPGEDTDRVLTDVSISALPNKTEYYVRQSINLEGLELLLTYNDGFTEIIDSTEIYNISMPDTATSGTKSVDVWYGEFMVSFDIEVMEIPEDAPKLVIESKKVNIKKDKVEVVFTLSNVSDVTSLGIANITFDENNFALNSGVWTLPGSPAMKNNYAIRNDIGVASAVYAEATNCNGAIFTLTLDILDTAEIGVSDITCEFSAKNVSETVEIFTVEFGAIELTAAIRGDVDGNEDVNSDDVIYMLNHTLFPELYPLLEEQGGDIDLDYDGDGEVTSNDVIYLLDYTLFPEYYPLT